MLGLSFFESFRQGTKDFANYVWTDVTTLSWTSSFYYIILISLVFWLWEIASPWRKKQDTIRKDFWLDGFYMFFNMFLFGLVGFAGVSKVATDAFNNFIGLFGLENIVAVEVGSWAQGWQLLLLFVVRDFVQWNTHRLLHRVPFLWELHKVHHSVEQMGFAAHLRYHWGENVVYNVIQYIPLAMIGFSIEQYFVISAVTLAIGHFNHSNIDVPLGPLKYIFNNPQMHIWHHAKDMPESHPYGINFGLSLSIWDYLFGTAHIPHSGRDIPLGFEGSERFPKTFREQVVYPFVKPNDKSDANE